MKSGDTHQVSSGPDLAAGNLVGVPRFHAALIAPALLFFAPVLFFGRALYVRDTGLYFYPHKALVAAAVRAGHLPQWSPAEYGGLPLLADPNFNVFHPLSVLTDFLPLPWGFGAFVFACSLIGAYGAAALARALGISRTGQLVAALAFAWSGPFLSLVESGPVCVAAFLPWLGVAALRRSVAWTAVAAALVLLSGTPEIGACGFVLGLALAGREGALRYLPGCALGAGLAAVQVFPTVAFLHESARAAGFEGDVGGYRLERLPGLLVPFFDGWLEGKGSGYWTRQGTAWIETIYLGAVPLALAALAVREKRLRALLIACLALSVLGWEPAFEAARAVLPPLRGMRFATKLLFPICLGVAVAAGAGWDALQPRRKLQRWAIGFLLLGLAALALGFLLPLDQLDPLRAECLRDTALRFAPLELAVLAGALALASRAQRPALFALLAFDLALPAVRMDRTLPAAELQAPPTAALFRDLGRDYRADVQAAGITAAELQQAGDPDWLPSRKLFWLRHEALFGPEPESGLLMMRGYSGLTPGRMKDFFQRGGKAALDQLSVRRALEFGGPRRSVYAAVGFKPEGQLLGGLLRLWRNDQALPRARLEGGTARIAKDEPELLEIETSSNAPGRLIVADGLTPGWTVSVDGAEAPALLHEGALRAVDVPQGQHRVRWTYLAPGLIVGAVVSLLSLLVTAFLFSRS